jgi:glyoxylase-like metal-dependent hydrolase (beta-lactamase superfamily II)
VVTRDAERLPAWVTWQRRPFPDANLLLIHGRQPALVDSGFVGHAQQTAAWAHAHTKHVVLVVNTHWHSDYVGGNALLQAMGAGIAASAPDAQAIARRDPGCCVAEYLDQPVAPYTVDEPLDDGQLLRLGDADWEVLHTPGHAPGHLSLWQPDERLLIVGDALSDYDVGWVNRALDGPDAAATALASLRRLADVAPRVLLPSHGPIPTDPGAAFTSALRRIQRLVDDPDTLVWHAARRIFAFALMIRDGIPVDEAEPYLLLSDTLGGDGEGLRRHAGW